MNSAQIHAKIERLEAAVSKAVHSMTHGQRSELRRALRNKTAMRAAVARGTASTKQVLATRAQIRALRRALLMAMKPQPLTSAGVPAKRVMRQAASQPTTIVAAEARVQLATASLAPDELQSYGRARAAARVYGQRFTPRSKKEARLFACEQQLEALREQRAVRRAAHMLARMSGSSRPVIAQRFTTTR